MSQAFVIRTARIEETDAVDRIDSLRLGWAKLSKFNADGGILVAVIGDEIIGYCGVRIHAKKPLAIVDGIVVSPGFNGQGIGMALLNAAEREAISRGCRSIGLEVHSRKDRLVDYYRGAGFRRRWRLNGKTTRYHDGTPALHMRKRLRSQSRLARLISSVVRLVRPQ